MLFPCSQIYNGIMPNFMKKYSKSFFGKPPFLSNNARLAILLVAFLFPIFCEASGTINILFYDRNGAALDEKAVRNISNNGKNGYNNDYLINPLTLRALSDGCLVTATNGTLFFKVPDAPVSLALNWPTSPLGYSLVVLDNGGLGFTGNRTVNFTWQGALDIKRKLDQAIKARPDYVPSQKFKTAYDNALAIINAVPTRATEPERGRAGQLAMDQLAIAYDAILSEHGPQHAIQQGSTITPWLATTLDSPINYESNIDLAARLTEPFGWIRIVFGHGENPSKYTAMVKYAKLKGLKIMGQPVDADDEKNYTQTEYKKRFTDFVSAFPEIDAWEVGNEVNGDWHSSTMAARIVDAIAEVKKRAPSKLIVLTLYFEINTGSTRSSMFSWIQSNLPKITRDKIDVVLVSLFPEQSPMGVFFDEMMVRLGKEFPTQKIGLGELGYSLGGKEFWWCQNEKDPDVTGRHAVALHYYNSMFDYNGSIGGGFWWNFPAEFSKDTIMQSTVTDLRDKFRESISPNLSGNAHSGSSFARANISNYGTFNDIYQAAPVGTNTLCTASIWLKGTGALELQVWGNINWTQKLASVRCNGSPTWKKVSTPAFNTGTRNQIWVALEDAYNGTRGLLFLDDIAVSSTTTNKNILINPSFENGTEGWVTNPNFVFQILKN